MQITKGLGGAISFLLACSGGVLNVGRSGGGTDVPPPVIPGFSAAAVEKASELCILLFNNDADAFARIRGDLGSTSYSATELRSDISGGWLRCTFDDQQKAKSYEFTADGYWYVLADDGNGGLAPSRNVPSAIAMPRYDGGASDYEGAYTFQDMMGRPLSIDAGTIWLATGGVPWFTPEFTALMGQQLMVMNFLDRSQNICVLVGR